MKAKFEIFRTNWINIAGIFIALYSIAILSSLFRLIPDKLTTDEFLNSLVMGFIGGLYGIIGYGFMFWIGFILVLFLLDMILMNEKPEYLRMKLLAEWVIISLPFVYWGVKYSKKVFVVSVIFFFITQFLREKKIRNVLTKINEGKKI